MAGTPPCRERPLVTLREILATDLLSLARGGSVPVPGQIPARGLSGFLSFLDRHRFQAYRAAAVLLLLGTAASLGFRSMAIGSVIPPTEAVRSSNYDFSGTVRGRPLAYRPMLTEGRDALADAIGWTFCGSYNSWTGRLVISSSVPGAVQRETLLHEYGHAAFEDVAYRSAGGGLAGNAYAWWVSTTGRLANRSVGRILVWTYPAPLRAMYGSYLAEQGSYKPESTNHEANLGEWFAESYARALDGRKMPAGSAAVLKGLSL